jgi:hypothetical protein
LAQLTLAGAPAYMLSYISQTMDILSDRTADVGVRRMIIGVVVGLPALRARPQRGCRRWPASRSTPHGSATPISSASPVVSRPKSPELFGWKLGWGLTWFDHISMVDGPVTLAVSIGVAMPRRSQLRSAMLAARQRVGGGRRCERVPG